MTFQSYISANSQSESFENSMVNSYLFGIPFEQALMGCNNPMSPVTHCALWMACTNYNMNFPDQKKKNLDGEYIGRFRDCKPTENM